MELNALNSSYDNLLKENRELREKLNQYEKAYPPKECPVCGHKGIDFIPFPNIIHKEVICPTCHCHERQRAIWIYFQKNKHLINDGTRILHFAPEKQFRELFTSKDTEYHTADFNPGDYNDADEQIDIQNIPYEDDLYLDLVVYPDGTMIEEDMDELQDALSKGDITQQQYDLALYTCDKLKKGLLSDNDAFKAYVQNMYIMVKQFVDEKGTEQ